MVVAFKVFKKTSPNGKLTLYLGKRDFVDHVTRVDPVDGVVMVDDDYLKHRKIFGQVVAIFRYGREEDEVMGLHFFKELCLAADQIYPPKEKQAFQTTKMQQRLMKKVGPNAYPFYFQIPVNAPQSVTLQPGHDDQGQACGIYYEVRVYVGEQLEDKPHKRSSVKLGIRKIQWAPSQPGRQPSSIIRKDFLLSPGELELEATLDRQLYHHGEDIAVNISIRNYSNKTVKRIRVSALQNIDVCMFASSHYTATVACVDTQEGCPISPGSSLQKVIILSPCLNNSRDRKGVALDGQIKKGDTLLASSTLLYNDQSPKDAFGIIVSYSVKVKLYMGALAGEVVADLPFLLMHPRPTAKAVAKDEFDKELQVEQFQSSRENTLDLDEGMTDAPENVVFEDFGRVRITQN